MQKGAFGGLYGSFVPWAKGNLFIKWISDNKESKGVVVCRCTKCGFIEIFAN